MYSSCHATDCILRVHVCFAAFPRFLYFAKQEKLSLATYKLPGGCHTDAEEPIQLYITLLHRGENRNPKSGTTPRPYLARRQVRTVFYQTKPSRENFSRQSTRLNGPTVSKKSQLVRAVSAATSAPKKGNVGRTVPLF